MKKRLFVVIVLLLLSALVLTSCTSGIFSIEISSDGYFVINGNKTDKRVPFADRLIDENEQELTFFLKEDGTYAVEIGYAKKLSKIEIPAIYNLVAVTEVMNFTSANLKEITLPNTVKKIDKYAFDDCTSLVSIIIPDSVLEIGKGAFSGCTALTSVVIPAGASELSGSVFEGCTSLENIYFRGSEEQWLIVSSGLPESFLESVTVHYNYIIKRASETQEQTADVTNP